MVGVLADFGKGTEAVEDEGPSELVEGAGGEIVIVIDEAESRAVVLAPMEARPSNEYDRGGVIGLSGARVA